MSDRTGGVYAWLACALFAGGVACWTGCECKSDSDCSRFDKDTPVTTNYIPGVGNFTTPGGFESSKCEGKDCTRP